MKPSADPARRRLVYCRTPLQAIILSRIQAIDPAHDTVLYQPTSASPKHRPYFDRIEATHKHFVPHRPFRPSYLIGELLTYLRVPASVRAVRFDEYLVSSFDSLIFSILSGSGSILKTFDDGVMNYSQSEMRMRIESEHWAYRLVKRAGGGRNNAATLRESSLHYTLYDHPRPFAGPTPTVRIGLASPLLAAAERRPVRLLLGTAMDLVIAKKTPESVELYERIRRHGAFDIFLPHPSEPNPPVVAEWLPNRSELLHRMEAQIAEDFIASLVDDGFAVEVFGILSSALPNVASFANAVNLATSSLADEIAPLFAQLGVPTIDAHTFLNSGAGDTLTSLHSPASAICPPA